MAVTFTGQSSPNTSLSLVNGLDLSTVTDLLNLNTRYTFTSGTGANQANAMWHDQRTLAASASETIDLNNSANSITDAFGRALEFTAVKFLYLRNTSTQPTIKLEPAAANGWTACFADDILVGPLGEIRLWNPSAAGWAITAGSLDEITLTETSGLASVIYDIAIVGLQ